MSSIERGTRRAPIEWIIDYASYFGYEITLRPKDETRIHRRNHTPETDQDS
jgi:hypothetical protein